MFRKVSRNSFNYYKKWHHLRSWQRAHQNFKSVKPTFSDSTRARFMYNSAITSTLGFTVSTATLFNNELSDKKLDAKDYESLLLRLNADSEKQFIEMITVMQEAIFQLSEDYRKCLENQMRALQKASVTDPTVDRHWDDLIRFRAESIDLKRNIEKLTLFIEHINQMVQSFATLSFLAGDDTAKSYVRFNMERLEQNVADQIERNKEFELQLLSVDRNSILQSPSLVQEGSQEQIKSDLPPATDTPTEIVQNVEQED